MPVYGQGDFYEEEEIEEEEFEETPQPKSTSRKPARQELPEEDDEEAKPEKKPKKPIKINPELIACVVGLVVVLIIIIFIVATVSANQRKKAEAKAEREALEQIQAMEDYYNEHPEERPTPADPNAVEPTETLAVSPAGVTVSYKLDDIKVLRKWGYTANELEVASRDGVSAKALVEQAKKDREAAQREALKEVSDTASPEYQNLLNKTWLGGDPIDLSGVDPNIVYNTETWTENVDYEKCGAQGTQLFIKLYLDNGTVAFMSVTPGRYVELADSGNIVVNLEALTSETLCVITKVSEVRVN